MTTEEPKIKEEKANYATPVAIVLAGLIIAGAVFYGNADGPKKDTNTDGNSDTVVVSLADNLEPVSPADHVRGSDDAPITVIEYSDLECPFCRLFHYSMQELLEEKGDEVKWVFRHFPLASLHQQAETEAVAAECAAKLGNEDSFWAFIDRVFDITPSNDGLDLATLPEIATFAGVKDIAKFSKCVEDNETFDIVNEDYQNAIDIGADGTPYVVMIGEDDQPIAIFREDLTQADPKVRALAEELFALYEKNIREAQ